MWPAQTAICLGDAPAAIEHGVQGATLEVTVHDDCRSGLVDAGQPDLTLARAATSQGHSLEALDAGIGPRARLGSWWQDPVALGQLGVDLGLPSAAEELSDCGPQECSSRLRALSRELIHSGEALIVELERDLSGTAHY